MSFISRLAILVVAILVVAAAASMLLIRNSSQSGSPDLSAAAIGTPLSDSLRTAERSIDDPIAWIEFEESIAQCMREAGFEYNMRTAEAEAPLADVSYGSDEYMAVFALGISTTSFLQRDLPDGLVGSPNSPLTDDSLLATNEEILDQLGEEERGAYLNELFSDGGCIDAATDISSAEQRQAHATLLTIQEQMTDELDDVFSRAEADPRTQQLDAEVTTCIQSAGLTVPAGGFGALLQQIADRAANLHRQTHDAGVEEALDPTLVPELEKLQDEEFEIAEALVVCDLSIETINRRFVEILREYEQAFISDNLPELSEIIDPVIE